MATLSALERVKAALLVSKVAGESATVVHTEALTIQLSRTTALDFSDSTITVEGDDDSEPSVRNKIQIPATLITTELIGDEVEDLDREVG